jgi:CheY-like chemotaxis protein
LVFLIDTCGSRSTSEPLLFLVDIGFRGIIGMEATAWCVEPPALTAGSVSVEETAAFQPLRVMIVDDNVDASDSLATLLEMMGFATCVFQRAKAALAAVQEFDPEACVLDISMPEMNGYELAERLRVWQKNSDLLLIAVTAHSETAAYERTKAVGFNRHIIKPASPQEILDVLFEYQRRIRVRSLYS